MKKSYVAFFPRLEEESWISKFRIQNDEKSHLVAPHMTLVFPTDIVSANELVEEVKKVTSGFKKFKVRIKSAIMMPEKGADGISSHIFLVPDEGFGEFVRLHDCLYSGKLNPALRLDIPFIPHLTIGSNLSLSEAKNKVDKLNSEHLDIEFLIDRLSVVEISDPKKDRILVDHCDLK